MNKNMLSNLLTVLSFLVTGVKAQISPVDYTGRWIINLEKSTFGDVPKFVVDTIITVHQTGDSIFIERSGADQSSNPYTVKESASLNGNPTITRTLSKSTKTLTIKWNEDSTILTKDAVYSIPDNPLQPEHGILQIWQLSAGKDSLIIENTAQNASNKYTVKAIYERASEGISGNSTWDNHPVKKQVEKIIRLTQEKKGNELLNAYDILEKMDSAGSEINPQYYAVFWRPKAYEILNDKKDLYLALEKRCLMLKAKNDLFGLNDATWYLVQPKGGLPANLRNYKFAIKWANYYTKNGTSNNAGDLDTLAWAYFGDGNKKRAAELEEKAIGLLAPDDPDRAEYKKSLITFKGN